MTVHQIIITYDTSKYDNLRRNSIGTINAYEEENDDQKNQQEHKLEVNIFWMPVTYISMNIVKYVVPYMQCYTTFLYLKSVQTQ